MRQTSRARGSDRGKCLRRHPSMDARASHCSAGWWGTRVSAVTIIPSAKIAGWNAMLYFVMQTVHGLCTQPKTTTAPKGRCYYCQKEQGRSVTNFQLAVQAQRSQRGHGCRQQVQADVAQAEVGRQTQGNQRGERRADQPCQIRRQCRTGVAELLLEVRRRGARCLAIRQAQQGKADQDEGILASGAAIDRPTLSAI
jgi:hypothetical protein